MKRVFICSPYGGDEKNLEVVKKVCRIVLENGDNPIAPHLYYPQFLDENDEEERELGIEMGCSLMLSCNEIWVIGRQITDGMKREITYAEVCGIPMKFIDVE